MEWAEYYDKFYDWSTSTQIRKMSDLTSYGPSDEVTEVAQEYMDEAVASRLVRRAVEHGVQFSPQEMLDLSCCCNTEAMNQMLASSKCKFSREELEDLWGAVDDDVLEAVAQKNHITLFDDGEDEAEELDAEELYVEEESERPQPKMGFFTKLAIGIGIAGLFGKKDGGHPGHCTGDCAHCPPHYGYRHGRWYYGHDHVYGCEFGGNRGSGGL